MIWDYAKLLGRMRQKSLTQTELAEMAGISPCSLNLKLNNKREFRQSEIHAICAALNIDVQQIGAYFFETGNS